MISHGVRTIVDRFIDVDIAVANFDIITAIGIGANPGFILNGRALATEVGKRNKITDFAFLTFRKTAIRFQEPPPVQFVNEVYNKIKLIRNRFKT